MIARDARASNWWQDRRVRYCSAKRVHRNSVCPITSTEPILSPRNEPAPLVAQHAQGIEVHRPAGREVTGNNRRGEQDPRYGDDAKTNLIMSTACLGRELTPKYREDGHPAPCDAEFAGALYNVERERTVTPEAGQNEREHAKDAAGVATRRSEWRNPSI